MHIKNPTTVATYGILSGIALSSFMLPDLLTVSQTTAAGPLPSTIELMGIVRDFKGTHPDFDVIPVDGLGDYAGSIDPVLGADGRPVFVDGAGYKVSAPWTDASGRPVAPAVYVAPAGGGGGGGGVVVSPFGVGIRTKGLIKLSKCTIGRLGSAGVVSTNSTGSGDIEIDGDSSIGSDVMVGVGGDPGTVIDNDGTITGSTGALTSPVAFPPITVPDDTVVGANVGDVEYGGGGTFTISTNMHTDDFRVKGSTVVRIDGDIKIHVEGEFRTETGGSIVVSPGSSLEIYITGSKVEIETKAAWSDPANSIMYVVGSPQMKIQTEAAFYGTIYAPDAKLLVQTKGQLFGSFIGNELEMKTEGKVFMTAGGIAEKFGPGFAVVDKLKTKGGSSFDGYDSTLGGYGGGNSGMGVAVSTNSIAGGIADLADTDVAGDVLCGPGGNPASAITVGSGCNITGSLDALDAAYSMPSVAAPSGMGSSVGDVIYDGGVAVLSSDVHCDTFQLKSGAKVQVDGNITIYTEGDFDMSQGSEIELLAGSTLAIYTDGDFKVYGSWLNRNTGNPYLVQAHLTGGTTFELDQAAHFHGLFAAPTGVMDIKNNSHFYGRFIGFEASVDGCNVHLDLWDGTVPPPAGCGATNDAVGAAGTTSSGGITSAATFDQWFNDVDGVNWSTGAWITLEQFAPGEYFFKDAAFFPVDGLMFGNEGEDHNYNFTYEIKADFVFNECTGQYIDFEVGDGTWMFIDDQLVMDLGGVNTTRQYAELDRLGLVDGQTYRLHFFYANRNPSTDGFKLLTNLQLSTEGILPPKGTAFD